MKVKLKILLTAKIAEGASPLMQTKRKTSALAFIYPKAIMP